MKVPQELPEFAAMLAGTPDAIITNPANKKSWPVFVKHVWQPDTGKAQTVEEIAKKRNNFYLEQVDGRWVVKHYSPVNFACQNIMKLYGFEKMDLICYSERSDSVLIVSVPFDRSFFSCCLQSVLDLLQQGTEFIFRQRTSS